MRVLAAVLGCTLLAGAAQAKPLVTHSEETPARLCLAGNDAPERVLALCDAALSEGVLTENSRSELLAAKAGVLFDLNRHADAEVVYGEAIAADAQNVQARNGLGWVLWDLGRHAAAAEVFQASVDIHVTGNALSGLASSGYRSGDMALGHAIEMLDAAVSIDPDDVWSMREKGWLLRQGGRLEDAEMAFMAALDVNGEDANAHYGLGRVLANLNRHEEALESYARAIALDGSEIGPYLHRSYALRALDRNAQAMRDAERVIEMDPTYSGGHVEKALALVALKQRSQALAIFEAAREAGIEDNYLLYWYADTLTEDGQDEQALSVIDAALALEGRAAVDYSLKAYIANRLDRFDAALEAAQAAVEADPDLAYAHYHAAVALLGQGDANAGMERLELAMDKGLPSHMVGEFASQLVRQGKYLAAIALRGKY